ncbi:MAG TPA: HAMP domain-containing sensor histidine kinase [Acidimicrobiia bacterium]|nr:HAMP domain-containing sensor histidine kinase [Acidimicrobiia bacterium]
MPNRGSHKEVAPSSLSRFLDEFQRVRAIIAGASLVAVIGIGFLVGFRPVSFYILGLGVTALHALWSWYRDVRSPRAMLVIDSTVWGGIMVLAGIDAIAAATLTLLVTFAVLLSDGHWRAGLLAYAAAWYSYSHFADNPITPASVGPFIGVLLIAGASGTVVYRLRVWLEHLDAQRSQMLGTVSHELRNSLTGMLGLTEIVSTDHSMGGDEARELVAMAHQQAVDAGEIVEDLLTATRVERSMLSVATETVDVNAEVATTVRRFSSEGTQLQVSLADDLPMARADSLRVRQILRNVVSNAIRYGGPTIRISTKAGSPIRVVVADDGEGVPVGDEKTIFLPYRRSTRPHNSSSVGLGLWISRELAHAMGGTLEYRRVGGWSEFELTLPVQPTPLESVGSLSADSR